MMKYMERVVFGGLVLLMLPISGFACSTGQWDASSGAITTASPPTITRYSELCAMQATNTGHVQDNSPSAHTTFIARFYVRPGFTGTGQADLFVAYSAENGTGQLIKVSYDGANLDFHSSTGTQLGTAVATINNWHAVEVKYVSAGTTSFWVNADATTAPPTGTFASATGAVESVRLGLPNGLGGFSASTSRFDAYESRSTTPVGLLLAGDANGNGAITIADVISAGNELGGTLAIGQPDCNAAQGVTIADVICIGNKL